MLRLADYVAQTLAAHGVRDTTYLKHEGDQAFINGLFTLSL